MRPCGAVLSLSPWFAWGPCQRREKKLRLFRTLLSDRKYCINKVMKPAWRISGACIITVTGDWRCFKAGKVQICIENVQRRPRLPSSCLSSILYDITKPLIRTPISAGHDKRYQFHRYVGQNGVHRMDCATLTCHSERHRDMCTHHKYLFNCRSTGYEIVR